MHMAMAFYWSPNLGDFFFPGLAINGTGPFSLLCIVLLVLAIVYEAMKVYSAKVRARTARERLRSSSCAPSETANLLAADRSSSAGPPDGCCSPRTAKLLAEACVFLVHNTLGYALMLSVMLFNGYVFVTVVAGMGLGYFLFGHISMRVNMENMQARTTKVICSPVCAEDQPSGSAGRPPIGDHADQLSGRSSSASGHEAASATTQQQHKAQLHYYPNPNYQSTEQRTASSPAVRSSSGSSCSPTSGHESGSAVTDSCRL